MSHIWRSHVTHMKESCHTYEGVMSHIWRRHVTRMNESYIWMPHSCVTWPIHTYGMTHSYMTWLIHIRGMKAWLIHIWYDSFILATHEWVMPFIWMSHVTYENIMSYMWHDNYDWFIYDMTHSYLSHMNESCHSYEWVMSHIEKSCHIRDIRNMTYSYRTWLIHMNGRTHSYVTSMNESCHIWISPAIHVL